MPSAQGTPVDAARADTAPAGSPRRAGGGPLLRTPVAVVVSRFPLVTETFILREIQELERQGQPVVLVPLLRERGPAVHREARPWMERALYTPFLSPGIVAANLRCLRRQPRTWLRLLGQILRGNARSVPLLARALALFPKSVFLAERLAAAQVGHVHAHFATHPAMAAWVIGTLAGIPYSVTAHAHDIFVRRDMLDVKLAGARFVRCVSEFNRRFLSERVPALRGALRVVHMGVALPEGKGVPPARPRLLCVAALKPYKGHAVLVEACARLRARGVDFTCDLVGDGPLRSTVRGALAAAGLHDHVRLLGALPQHEVAALMAQATVVVQPSVVAADGQMEGIPVALMEAMAARKPVVASALSGVPELVEDGVSGLLVPPEDSLALAEAVERILRQPDVARWMGEQGRRKVEREFTLDDTVRQLLDALDPHRLPPPASWRDLVAAVGGSWRALGLRRAQERPESSVAELLLGEPAGGAPPGQPRELVLKVHHGPQGEPSPRTARREFQALAALEHRLESANDGPGAVRLGTPLPLGLDESEGAVLMEACAGEPMDALVRRSRWRGAAARAAAQRAAGLAGAWLRALQEVTGEEADDALLVALCDAARADLASAALPSALAHRVRERLETLPARLRADSRAAVGTHGDFWPGNVFVGEHSLQVVDLEGFGRGLPYEDAAYFAVQLGLFYAYPHLRARGRRMRAAFLEGWRPGAALDAAAWTLCLTAKALQVLVHTREAGAGWARGAWRARALHAALWAAEP